VSVGLRLFWFRFGGVFGGVIEEEITNQTGDNETTRDGQSKFPSTTTFLLAVFAGRFVTAFLAVFVTAFLGFVTVFGMTAVTLRVRVRTRTRRMVVMPMPVLVTVTVIVIVMGFV